MRNVVITGIGMVTPLGQGSGTVLDRVLAGDSVAREPDFNTADFDCHRCAAVTDLDAESHFPDNKTLRLMSRDAQMAVVAAKFAMDDAGVIADNTYPAREICLYGSTGVASMSMEEIAQIIRHAVHEDGTFSLDRFGRVALKRVRPVLSFRILANMPLCFVSIFLNIKGANGVYTPWEGNGVHAIAAGIRAIRRGHCSCALVGGCDIKTRELSFINLQQAGIFDSWKKYHTGTIPGEGAAFLVLEDEAAAIKRGKISYARVSDYRMGSLGGQMDLANLLQETVRGFRIDHPLQIIAASDGDVPIMTAEQQALERSGIQSTWTVGPKAQLGNLFAAAAPVQVGLGADLASRQQTQHSVMANCFGYGSEQGSFLLETP